MSPAENLVDQVEQALREREPARKVALTQGCREQWLAGRLVLRPLPRSAAVDEPGRPARPALVPPRELPKRRLNTRLGHGALIHSLCHIEFNAINLALDAVHRFRDLAEDYYSDWLQVAAEEAYHFSLLREHLQSLGFDYGDFDAHDGLWQAARETAHDPLVRMALVPRVMEARGLDVTPGIMAKLQDAGDGAAVAILQIIQRDEIGHVNIGTRWFRYLCQQRALDPEPTFQQLLQDYMKGRIKGPLAWDSRRQAGFTEEELRFLSQVS
jgi:uncharacterized ferritin-like protein (DUF455 family)